MNRSAPRRSTPLSYKPIRIPSSHATPATPPPPSTSDRVFIAFDVIRCPPKKTICIIHKALASSDCSTAPLPSLIISFSPLLAELLDHPGNVGLMLNESTCREQEIDLLRIT